MLKNPVIAFTKYNSPAIRAVRFVECMASSDHDSPPMWCAHTHVREIAKCMSAALRGPPRTAWAQTPASTAGPGQNILTTQNANRTMYLTDLPQAQCPFSIKR